MRQKIVVGTRGSQLARCQAEMVVAQLRKAQSTIEVQQKIIATRGDDSKMSDVRAGRKGLFTEEIERALVTGEIDIAVHSAKDLPSRLAERTGIAAVLARASVEDVLVVKEKWNLNSLPDNAVVATGSIRRQHQLHWRRPDLDIVELRGNVPTRLQKLGQNQWNGIVLARAGLERLGFNISQDTIHFESSEFFVQILSPDIFLPAGGQGVIAIQSRKADADVKMLLNVIDDEQTHICLEAERGFLRLLNADCNQPVGVLATLAEKAMKIRAQVFNETATTPRTAAIEGDLSEAEILATQLFEKIFRP